MSAVKTPNGINARSTDDIPDISFKTASTPLFPTPQEYEEQVKKTGHFIAETDKLTVGRVIVSVLGILAACGVIFLVISHILSLPADEGAVSAGTGNEFFYKLGVLYGRLENNMASGDTAATAKTIGLWLGVSLAGLLAGCCDILLRRIPLDKQITGRFSFGVNPLVRYLPAIVVTLHSLFVYIAGEIDGSLDFTLNSNNFSLTGEGYTWCTWVTEGFDVLFILASLFALIEMFSNSGIFGMIIRLPLAVISNGAVVMVLMTGTRCAVIVTLMFVFVKVLGIILKNIFPSSGIYYRTYN